MIGDYVQPVFVVASENLFDKGSSTLRPEAIRELDRAVTFISRFKPIKVRIEGHTDSDGLEDVNMQLSEGRARSVKAYLVSQGSIDENVLIPVGYGETKPIASNDTPDGQRKNRRFEIVIEQ
jgi:outer membrane protein OmpA-like peptidoglycan-associated protein